MTTQTGFRAFYETHLTPKLIELEKQRKKIVGKLTLISFGYFVLMMLVVRILIVLDNSSHYYSNNLLKTIFFNAVIVFIIMVTTLILFWIATARTARTVHYKKHGFLFALFIISVVMAYIYLLVMLIIISILVVFDKVTYLGGVAPWNTLAILMTVGIWIFYFNFVAPKKTVFQRNFKKEILPSLVTFIDDNLSYDPDKTVSVEAFHTSRLFKHKYGKKVDKWIGDNYVEGTLNSIPTTFSEVYALEEEINHYNSAVNYALVFHGLFFVFNFQLNFKGITLVVPSQSKVVDKYVVSQFSKVTLDDPELAAHFIIYSENPEMARYVLSTEFMRRFLTLSRRFQQQVYLSFVNGKLYMAISVKKDLFEVRLTQSLNFALIKEFFDYLRLGKEMVEELGIYLNQPKPSLPSEDISKTGTEDAQTQLENHQTIPSLPKKYHSLNELPATIAPYEHFKVFYQTYLKPKLRRFEKQRKAIAKQKRKQKIGEYLITFLVVLLVIFMFILTELNLNPRFFAIFFVLLLVTWLVILLGRWLKVISSLSNSARELARELFHEQVILPYQTNFKKEIIGSIVAFVDNNLRYDPDKQIPASEFQASGLWKQNQNLLIGEDYGEGVIDQTDVTFSEIHAKYRNNPDKKTVKGLFFVFNFHFDFEGVTVVSSKAQSFFGSTVYQSLPWQGKEAGLNLVKLADPEFDQAFAVYSDNPAMVESVFSAGFRQRLLAFQRRLDKTLFLSFVNGKLYMVIGTDKDLFEAPIDRTVLDFKLMTEFCEYLYIGKEIVEEFSLEISTTD